MTMVLVGNLQPLEMRNYRTAQHISYVDRISNDAVRNRITQERNQSELNVVDTSLEWLLLSYKV